MGSSPRQALPSRRGRRRAGRRRHWPPGRREALPEVRPRRRPQTLPALRTSSAGGIPSFRKKCLSSPTSQNVNGVTERKTTSLTLLSHSHRPKKINNKQETRARQPTSVLADWTFLEQRTEHFREFVLWSIKDRQTWANPHFSLKACPLCFSLLLAFFKQTLPLQVQCFAHFCSSDNYFTVDTLFISWMFFLMWVVKSITSIYGQTADILH